MFGLTARGTNILYIALAVIAIVVAVGWCVKHS